MHLKRPRGMQCCWDCMRVVVCPVGLWSVWVCGVDGRSVVAWEGCRVWVGIWSHSGGSARKLVVLMHVVVDVVVLCVYPDME